MKTFAKKRLLLFNIKMLLLRKLFPKLVKSNALVFLIQLLEKINIRFSELPTQRRESYFKVLMEVSSSKGKSQV